MAKNWIKGAIKHKGALHRDLGVPEGEKIPEGKLKAAESEGGKVGKRARLAETLKKMHDGEKEEEREEEKEEKKEKKGKKGKPKGEEMYGGAPMTGGGMGPAQQGYGGDTAPVPPHGPATAPPNGGLGTPPQGPGRGVTPPMGVSNPPVNPSRIGGGMGPAQKGYDGETAPRAKGPLAPGAKEKESRGEGGDKGLRHGHGGKQHGGGYEFD